MLTILFTIFFLLVLIFLSSIYCCSLLSLLLVITALSHTGAHFSLFYWYSFLSSPGAHYSLFYWCSLLCLPILVLITFSFTDAHFSGFLLVLTNSLFYWCSLLSLPSVALHYLCSLLFFQLMFTFLQFYLCSLDSSFSSLGSFLSLSFHKRPLVSVSVLSQD